MIGEHMQDDLTLEKIDYEWVQATTKIPRLKKALRLLEQDGSYFIDLIRCIEKRMVELDPKYATRDFSNNVDPQEKAILKNDISQWTQDVTEDTSKSDIFGSPSGIPTTCIVVDSSTITPEQSKKMAENEKNKGNEALKSNDLLEAQNYYTKSIQYNPQLAASHCNRALVLLKLKKYSECIADCDSAIKLQSDYTKAYHRRAKANFALKNNLKAYQDFKFCIELEPDNSEVNGELRECRASMSEADIKLADNVVVFKKVKIIEEDEDDEVEQEKHVTSLDDFKKELEAIEDIKQRANAEIKKAMYNVAIDILMEGLRISWKVFEQLQRPTDIHTLKVLRCSILSNIALCYMNLQEHKRVVEYCDTLLVEEQHLVVSNKELLIKAYLRRALSHESLDKLVQSKQDYVKVKSFDASNIQATKGLDRLQKLMTPEEQVKYQKLEAQSKLQSEALKNQEALKTQQQNTKKSQDIIKQEQQKATPIIETKPDQKVDFDQLNDQLIAQKDKGNTLFKEKKLTDAVLVFTQGVQQYEQYSLKSTSNKAFPIYIQILTNLCLVQSNLGQTDEVIALSTKVLLLDPNNLKALYRRSLAYAVSVDVKEQQKEESLNYLEQVSDLLDKSRRDLEKIILIDQSNAQATEKLKEVQSRNIQYRLKLKELRSQDAKINNFITQDQGETSVDQNANVTPSARTKLEQISINIGQSVVEQLLKNPNPESASVFEKNMQIFKNETKSYLVEYVSRIAPEVFKKIYANASLPPEILIQTILCCRSQVVEQSEQVTAILRLLPQTKKFDFTLMCLSKKEKAVLLEVIELLQEDIQKEIKNIYKL